MSSRLRSSVASWCVCLKGVSFWGAVCIVVPLIWPSVLVGRTVSGITEAAASILCLQVREPRQQQVIVTVKELPES